MANELVHGTQGTVLTQAEFEAVGLHVCNSQATGDLIYASSATQLTRLAIGATNTVLQVVGGIPAWVASPVITNIVPGANFTLTQNGVAVFTSVESGAIVNTLYLSAGKVGIGTTGPGAPLHILSTANPQFKVAYDATYYLDINQESINSFGGALLLNAAGTTQNVVIATGGGKVGAGVTTPTAVVHLKAGTAAANTAPMKFTSGTNLTTPEAGAVEWNGTNLFITQTDGTRKTIAYV